MTGFQLLESLNVRYNVGYNEDQALVLSECSWVILLPRQGGELLSWRKHSRVQVLGCWVCELSGPVYQLVNAIEWKINRQLMFFLLTETTKGREKAINLSCVN